MNDINPADLPKVLALYYEKYGNEPLDMDKMDKIIKEYKKESK